MTRIKPLLIALFAAVAAMIVSFIIVYGGGLFWDVSLAPNDGQAGMGWFFVAAAVAPVAGLVTLVEIYAWLRRKSANSL